MKPVLRTTLILGSAALVGAAVVVALLARPDTRQDAAFRKGLRGIWKQELQTYTNTFSLSPDGTFVFTRITTKPATTFTNTGTWTLRAKTFCLVNTNQFGPNPLPIGWIFKASMVHVDNDRWDYVTVDPPLPFWTALQQLATGPKLRYGVTNSFTRARVLTATTPQITKRIQQDIRQVEGESLEESLAKLAHVNFYYSPGPPTSNYKSWDGKLIPLSPKEGQDDIDAIMSNRRFRKVYEGLSKLSKPEATAMVKHELSAAIAEHATLYKEYPEVNLGGTNSQGLLVVPSFPIGVPDDRIVVTGARLKVLALVWTSGMLGLTGTSNEVARVAQMAVRQRTELYGDPAPSPFYKAQVLERASLYNRQLIATGLLGILGNPELQASAARASAVQWQERKLAVYNAPQTEYDPPFRTGDYSFGEFTVKFAAPMDDERFNTLLKQLHL